MPPIAAGLESETVNVPFVKDSAAFVPAATETVVVTTPQTFNAVNVFLGFGIPVVKSLELLLLSVQPPLALISAVVVLGAGAGAASEQFAVEPYPMISIIDALAGHAPDNASVLFTSATFPAVADIAIVPVKSAVGRVFTPLVLKASATK